MHTKALLRRGEIFTGEDGTARKASVTASTKGILSLAARACYYDGLIQKGFAVGDYITRQCDNSVHLINTLRVQPKNAEVNYIFTTQCNQIVTLTRQNSIGKFEVYAENVLIFMDTTLRSLNASKDGLVSQDITVIHIPKRFNLKKLDRVYIAREGVPLDSADSVFYQVDSINTALTPMFDWVDNSGVDVMQLSADTRGNELDLGGTDPTEPTDPSGWW